MEELVVRVWTSQFWTIKINNKSSEESVLSDKRTETLKVILCWLMFIRCDEHPECNRLWKFFRSRSSNHYTLFCLYLMFKCSSWSQTWFRVNIQCIQRSVLSFKLEFNLKILPPPRWKKGEHRKYAGSFKSYPKGKPQLRNGFESYKKYMNRSGVKLYWYCCLLHFKMIHD